VVFFWLGAVSRARGGDHALNCWRTPAQHSRPPAMNSRPKHWRLPRAGDGIAAQARRSGRGDGRYYEDARRLSGMLTNWARKIPSRRHRFVVTSGGGPGIMEAIAALTRPAERPSGMKHTVAASSRAQPVHHASLNFEFHYFFMRKLWFATWRGAGGFQAVRKLDESRDSHPSPKLKTSQKITVVIYGRITGKGPSIWTCWWIRRISPKDIELFQFCRHAGAGFELLRRGSRRTTEGRGGRRHLARARR